ncbi:MAG TPA: hypothetical protein VM598_14990, partial [Bdellovibrionota bacterium]|nr:hypothetical protein [Bdellovibrionota bacterium]
MITPIRLCLALLIMSVGFASCKAGPEHRREPAESRPQLRDELKRLFPRERFDPPRLCGAIRGNGTQVFSTIASLASFTENYGIFDALSGASS